MAKQPHKRVRRALKKYVASAKNPKKATKASIPSNWIPVQARRLPNGKVQLKVNPARLRRTKRK